MDHLQNVDTASDTAKGDPRTPQKWRKKKFQCRFRKNILENQGVKDHLRLNALPAKNPGGDPVGDPLFFIPNHNLSLQGFISKAFRIMKGSDPRGDP